MANSFPSYSNLTLAKAVLRQTCTKDATGWRARSGLSSPPVTELALESLAPPPDHLKHRRGRLGWSFNSLIHFRSVCDLFINAVQPSCGEASVMSDQEEWLTRTCIISGSVGPEPPLPGVDIMAYVLAVERWVGDIVSRGMLNGLDRDIELPVECLRYEEYVRLKNEDEDREGSKERRRQEGRLKQPLRRDLGEIGFSFNR